MGRLGDKKRGQATFLGEAKGARPHFAALGGGLIVLSQDGSSRPLSLTSIGDVTPREFITNSLKRVVWCRSPLPLRF